MIPFLKSIAEAYTYRYDSLQDFLFVFPNKRSGTFFLRYLKETENSTTRNSLIMPEITTISDFVEFLSGKVVANKIDLLFRLYNLYQEEIIKELADKSRDLDPVEIKQQDFDSFRSWGETVISDFNTVDQYLVDPYEIFNNVRDFKSISSNFLTEEQKEVLKEYFGNRFNEETDESFWKNFDPGEGKLSKLKQSFIYIWRLMDTLYNSLHENLEKEGLTTSGGVYRLAYENLQKKGKEIIPWAKIVFVGFNALSASEFSIFSFLSKMNSGSLDEPLTDFYWDATGPVLTGSDNSASRFVRANIKRFPSPEWAKEYIALSDCRDMPKIEVITAPSNNAQVKIVGELLKNLKSQIGEDKFKEAKVAVVLPDENLLIPMLYSISPDLGKVNLSMGYSFRLSSVYSFLLLLRRLFKNCYIDKEGNKSFYYKDIKLILSQPISHLIFETSKIDNFKRRIEKYHLIRISEKEIIKNIPLLQSVLNYPETDSNEEIINYLNSLLNNIKKGFNDSFEDDNRKKLAISDVDTALDALTILTDIVTDQGVNLGFIEFLRLFERLLANQKVMFEGKPLIGLQVLGTLETRSLDFDYLFVLSMNERIMPRRMKIKSFIPDVLRRGYGMPPSNYAEELFAYYFYRMISRARNVTLLYDGRTGTSKGAVSRYILQLRYLFSKNKLKERSIKFLLSASERKEIKIEKSDLIKDKLEEFCREESKYFSVSNLSRYRICEIQFLFKTLMGLDSDPESTESIDAITTGNIIHNVMMELYIPDESKRGRLLTEPIRIEKAYLENILKKKDSIIHNLVTKYVNIEHFKNRTDPYKPLEGSTGMQAKYLESMVETIVKYDLSLAPFNLYGTEVQLQQPITLPSGRTVYFKSIIDRIDEINISENSGEREDNSIFRIIDYKTGSTKLEVEDFGEVLKGNYKGEQIFQLFIYAWLLTNIYPEKFKEIRTEIYQIKNLSKNHRSLPKIASVEVENYGDYKDIFSEEIVKLIDEIYTKEYFEECSRESDCEKCKFRTLCGK